LRIFTRFFIENGPKNPIIGKIGTLLTPREDFIKERMHKGLFSTYLE
jgi:hypothetical protein